MKDGQGLQARGLLSPQAQRGDRRRTLMSPMTSVWFVTVAPPRAAEHARATFILESLNCPS